MKKIILDTNFILSCLDKKIDFFNELIEFEIIIPKQVLDELKRISESKQKLKFRDLSKISIQLINKNKPKIIDIRESYVDKGLIKYLNKNKETYLGTLDKELMSKIKNKKVIIRQKKLEVRE